MSARSRSVAGALVLGVALAGCTADTAEDTAQPPAPAPEGNPSPDTGNGKARAGKPKADKG